MRGCLGLLIVVLSVVVAFAADDEAEPSLLLQMLEGRGYQISNSRAEERPILEEDQNPFLEEPHGTGENNRISLSCQGESRGQFVSLEINHFETADEAREYVFKSRLRVSISAGSVLIKTIGTVTQPTLPEGYRSSRRVLPMAQRDETLPGEVAQLRFYPTESKEQPEKEVMHLVFTRGTWFVWLQSFRWMSEREVRELASEIDDVLSSDKALAHFGDAVRSIARRNHREALARRTKYQIEADNLAHFEKLKAELEKRSSQVAAKDRLIEEIAELSVKESVPLLNQILRDQAETEEARSAALRSIAGMRPDMAWPIARKLVDETAEANGSGSPLIDAASGVVSSLQRLTLLEILEREDIPRQHAELSLYVSLLGNDLLKDGKWFDRDWSQLESASLNDRAAVYGYSTLAEAYGQVLDELQQQGWSEARASRFEPLGKMILLDKTQRTSKYAHLPRAERKTPKDIVPFGEIGIRTFAYSGGFDSLESWIGNLDDERAKKGVLRHVRSGVDKILEFWAGESDNPDRGEQVVAILTSPSVVEAMSQPFYGILNPALAEDSVSRDQVLEKHKQIGTAYAENPNMLWSLASILMKAKSFALATDYATKAIALVETKEAKGEGMRAETAVRMLPMYRSTLAKALTANRKFTEAAELIEGMSESEAKWPKLSLEWSKALDDDTADEKLIGLQSDLAKGTSWDQVALLCRLRTEHAAELSTADDLVLQKLHYLCQVQAGKEWQARELRKSLLETLPEKPGTRLMKRSSQWRYHTSRAGQKRHWYELEADDSAWSEGKAPIGYGNEGDLTELPEKTNTAYFRKRFTVSDVSGIQKLVIHLQHDDGAVVYLNGNEVVRDNMPSGKVGFGTSAKQAMGKPGYIPLEITPSALRQGENLLAVEVHQANPRSSDLRFDLELVANGKAISSVLDSLTVADAKRVLGMAYAELPDALVAVIEEQKSRAKLPTWSPIVRQRR